MTGKKLHIKNPGFVAISLAATLSAGVFLSSGQIWEGIRVSHYTSQTEDVADCTILFYMNGSDLESDYQAASADLDEIQSALDELGNGDTKINIAVEAGGCLEWSYEPIMGCKYSRFTMEAHNEPRVQSMEPRNMGRADTLSDFINYATTSYPARHYGLVFWNHGQGPINGFGSDQNFGHDSLTLSEIQEGLAKSDFDGRFDFVAFDACLMASYELVSIMDGYTQYLVASEDLEPQDGYDYIWLEDLPLALHDSSHSFGYNIAVSILASYRDYYIRQGNSATLSMVDMSQYEDFQQVFKKCLNINRIAEAEDFCRLLQQNRSSIRGYGGDNLMMVPDIVDMKALIATALEVGGQTELMDAFYEAFDELVVKSVVTDEENRSSGLSIFLPSDSEVTDTLALDIYKEIPVEKGYREFVDLYWDYLAREIQIDWQNPTVVADEIRVDISQKDLEKIANVYLQTYILQEDEGVAYLLSSDSAVTIDWNGFIKAKAEHTFWGSRARSYPS